MAPALLIFAVLICCSGVSSGATLTQPPSQSVSLGQTAKLLCTISGSVGNFHWVRQRLGQGPHFVIYGSTRGEGIPDRFTSSGSGSDYYLTITNSKAEDEADYYCVAWESSGVYSRSPWTQPALESVAPGQTAKLSCTVNNDGNTIYWHQQRAGQAPRFVHCTGCSSRGEGFSDRFTATKSGNIGYLTITNVQAGEVADYYCLMWSSTDSMFHSGKI